jgi:hypothetical protein
MTPIIQACVIELLSWEQSSYKEKLIQNSCTLISYSLKHYTSVNTVITIFNTISKNESRLKSPICLCVCLSMSPTNKIFNRLVDFHEIYHRGNDINGDLDAIILIP